MRSDKQPQKGRTKNYSFILISFLVVALFFIPNVSAFEFDNVKDYNPTTKTITITNAFGLGEKYTDIQLTTPLRNKVGTGYQKVAELKVNGYAGYKELLSNMEFYDVNNKMKKINREFDYKILSYENVLVDDYKFVEIKMDSKTNGTQETLKEKVKVGSHYEKREVWTKIDNIDLKENDVLIVGIFTDVKPGDYVEWIPTIAGKEITEWAFWTTDLDTNLIAYYKFDDNLTDETTNHDLEDNLESNFATGVINNGRNYADPTASDKNNSDISDFQFGTNDFSISFWIDSSDTTGMFMAYSDSWIDTGGWAMGCINNAKLQFGTDGVTMTSASDVCDGNLHNVIITREGTGAGETKMYIDGDTTPDITGTFNINFNANAYLRSGYLDGNWKFTGVIDEFGIWNGKALSTAEVSALYNGGSGLKYQEYLTDSVPVVTTHYPTNNSNFTISTITTNATVYDGINLTDVNFYVDGAFNQTNNSGINNSVYTFNVDLSDGTHTLQIEGINNNSASANGSLIYVNIDTINPLINLTSPNTTYAYVADGGDLNLNWTVSDDNLDSCWYQYANFNEEIETLSNPLVSYFNFTGSEFANGYDMNVYTKSGTFISEIDLINVSATCFIENPKIRLDSVAAGSSDMNISCFNGTGYELLYEENFAYTTLQRVTLTAINESVNCSLNTTTFNYTQGYNNITFFANDTFGNIASESISWFVNISKIDEYYKTPVVEGTINVFNITLYSPVQITKAYLNYNSNLNTASITSSGDNTYIISKQQKAPAVDELSNITFYWNITRSDGFSYETDDTNQTVSTLSINSTCTGMYNIMNFTILNEKTQVKINGTAENSLIKVDLELYTSDYSENLIDFYSEYQKTNPISICMSENLSGGDEYLLNVQVQYGTDNHSTEFYNIERYVLNSTTMNNSINLYDLDNANAQNFRLLVKDTAYLPMDGALVQIERKYLENGTFYITEIPKTDGSGITSASLELNDVIYSFYVYLDGVFQYSLLNKIAICQNPTITQCEIDLNSFLTGINIPDYEEGDDFNFTLDYNKTSRFVSSSYVIPSGEPSTVQLIITSQDSLGTSVCSDSLISASGELTCEIPNTFGNSTVIAKLYKDNVEQGVGTVKLDQTSSDIYSVSLILISLLVLMTLIGLSVTDNPVVSAVMLFVGVILMFGMNLIENTGFYGATATILYLGIAIILIIVKAGRRN